MKIETSELEGAALDWAVARAAGYEDHVYTNSAGELRQAVLARRWAPSTDWSQGGPMIGRISSLTQDYSGNWYAIPKTEYEVIELSGPTLLIAAMRAIVASELGDTVDVPEELLT